MMARSQSKNHQLQRENIHVREKKPCKHHLQAVIKITSTGTGCYTTDPLLGYTEKTQHHFSTISAVVVVQSLSHIWLFATSCTAARQAPLPSTISWSWLEFTSTESGMLSNHLILCLPFSFCLQSFPVWGSFPTGLSTVLAQESVALIQKVIVRKHQKKPNRQTFYRMSETSLECQDTEDKSETVCPRLEETGQWNAMWDLRLDLETERVHH